MNTSELKYIRSFFPGLEQDFIFFDNAGGTQTAQPVADRIQDYLLHTNVQLGASYSVSQESGRRVDEARKTWAKMLNAKFDEEIIFGSSTTQLLQNLAKSMALTFKAGDEVIVTNCDHEANIGPWMGLQKHGVVVKQWKINRETYELNLDDLENLINPKTKLVAFTHTSNVLGMINPVKAITKKVHEYGAMVCVDGVAYAPHRLINVQELDVDFYVFSMYKVYGPHYSLLYGKKNLLKSLPGINHYFIGNEEIPYKLQPGNVNFELSYGLLGIADYFSMVNHKLQREKVESNHHSLIPLFDKIAKHEEDLSTNLIDFLKTKSTVRIIGSNKANKEIRVPTISFVVDGKSSRDITLQTDLHKIGIRFGDFYARRLIEFLKFEKQDGVVRVSMVHYNTLDEVSQLINVLDGLIL